jgi:hypothetical protein
MKKSVWFSRLCTRGTSGGLCSFLLGISLALITISTAHSAAGQPSWSLRAGAPLAQVRNQDDKAKMSNRLVAGYSLAGCWHWSAHNSRWEWSAGLSLDGYRTVQVQDGGPGLTSPERQARNRMIYLGLPLSVAYQLAAGSRGVWRVEMGILPAVLLNYRRAEQYSEVTDRLSTRSVRYDYEMVVNGKQMQYHSKATPQSPLLGGSPEKDSFDVWQEGALSAPIFSRMVVFGFAGLGYRHAISETLSLDFSFSLRYSINDFERKGSQGMTSVGWSQDNYWASGRAVSHLLVPTFSIGIYKTSLKKW